MFINSYSADSNTLNGNFWDVVKIESGSESRNILNERNYVNEIFNSDLSLRRQNR